MDGEQWVCADGRRIHIYEMGTDHLFYCVAKIRRTPGWRQHWLIRLEAELARRLQN